MIKAFWITTKDFWIYISVIGAELYVIYYAYMHPWTTDTAMIALKVGSCIIVVLMLVLFIMWITPYIRILCQDIRWNYRNLKIQQENKEKEQEENHNG